MIIGRYQHQLQNYLPIFLMSQLIICLEMILSILAILTKETARDCINKQLTLLNVEEQNRLIGYIDGILDSKKGK